MTKAGVTMDNTYKGEYDMSIFRKREKTTKKPSNFDWISYILVRFFESIDELQPAGEEIWSCQDDETRERDYVLESQAVFKNIINTAVMEGKITFIGMETGTILECPDCNLPAEIRFQAVDEYENRMFLLNCIDGHGLWVDLMYIEYALDKKARELL